MVSAGVDGSRFRGVDQLFSGRAYHIGRRRVASGKSERAIRQFSLRLVWRAGVNFLWDFLSAGCLGSEQYVTAVLVSRPVSFWRVYFILAV
jgi:hypothetical protein